MNVIPDTLDVILTHLLDDKLSVLRLMFSCKQMQGLCTNSLSHIYPGDTGKALWFTGVMSSVLRNASKSSQEFLDRQDPTGPERSTGTFRSEARTVEILEFYKGIAPRTFAFLSRDILLICVECDNIAVARMLSLEHISQEALTGFYAIALRKGRVDFLRMLPPTQKVFHEHIYPIPYFMDCTTPERFTESGDLGDTKSATLPQTKGLGDLTELAQIGSRFCISSMCRHMPERSHLFSTSAQILERSHLSMSNNKLRMLDWIRETYPTWLKADTCIMDAAINNRDPEVTEWLYKHNLLPHLASWKEMCNRHIAGNGFPHRCREYGPVSLSDYVQEVSKLPNRIYVSTPTAREMIASLSDPENVDVLKALDKKLTPSSLGVGVRRGYNNHNTFLFLCSSNRSLVDYTLDTRKSLPAICIDSFYLLSRTAIVQIVYRKILSTETLRGILLKSESVGDLGLVEYLRMKGFSTSS